MTNSSKVDIFLLFSKFLKILESPPKIPWEEPEVLWFRACLMLDLKMLDILDLTNLC